MTEKFFLTNQKDSREAFFHVIESVCKAAADTISEAAGKNKTDSNENSVSAYSGLPPLDLRRLLNSQTILPEEGKGFDVIISKMTTDILPNLVRTVSPGYMAHLHSPVLLESLAAELIISIFNQSMDSWDQSPAATEIEVLVIKELCRLFGYGEKSDGVFTSGGSQSNTTAILLARDYLCKTKLKHDVKKLGLPSEYRKFKMYASEVSHFSMEKSAHLLGLGYTAVEKVPVDKQRKMDAEKLEELIKKDISAGFIPFCTAVTIGTTDYGSIDPVKEAAALCEKYGMWLHADAAYGSGLIMSQNYKSRIDGINLCDSITVDFHKMFLQPISCGALLIKNAENFSPLELHADYLNREEDEEDGYINLVGKSLQTTRRFDALKIWTSFQVRGQKGWNNIINTCVENAAYVYEKLSCATDFETISKPEISSVVFRILPSEKKSEAFTDGMNKSIRRTLLHKKGVVIGQTVDCGRVFLKFTLLNPSVTKEYLDQLLTLILSLRDEYQAQS